MNIRLRHEVEAEELAWAEELAEIHHVQAVEERRRQLRDLGHTREMMAAEALKLMPDPAKQGNPKWWDKLRHWLEEHPYAPDEHDDLIAIAKDPHAYGYETIEDWTKRQLRNTKDIRFRRLGTKHTPETKEQQRRAMKLYWKEHRAEMVEAIRKSQDKRLATLRKNIELGKELRSDR